VNAQTTPYFVGHQLHFECPSPFHLVGSRTHTCQVNGQWSGVISACDKIGSCVK